MVSFSCEVCGDVLTKKKLDPHRNRCRGAYFTCVDCMVTFPGTEYRSHTNCMTEEQKYQGALYKPKNQQSDLSRPQTNSNSKPTKMASQAYVEDVVEEDSTYRQYQIHDSEDEDGRSTANPPPEAPTPPPAVDTNVNVFDFLVGNPTPNASNLDLARQDNSVEMGESTQLIRYDRETNGYVDQSGYMVDDEDMVQYGTGPIPRGGSYETPVPKGDRRQKDKKRKRLHIDTNSPPTHEDGADDQVMTDAPAELHSGLTGSLNRLMRPAVFPPSPDYSGGDAAEHSPTGPAKKSKHKSSKPGKGDSFVKALMSGSSKPKASKKRKHSPDRKEKKRHKHHSHHEKDKAPKLIGYHEHATDGRETEGQMIVYKPRSELFLSMCTKGPESERGYSMNKALKRFHRERASSGTSLGKLMEEKELWRSLRMRRNDRGEVVLFSI